MPHRRQSKDICMLKVSCWYELWVKIHTPGPEFLNFLEPQASIPRYRFLVRNQFRCGIDSWRHEIPVKELKRSKLSSSYFVCRARASLLIKTFPTCKWHISAGDKSRLLLKTFTFYEACPTRFRTWFLFNSRNRFLPHIIRLKIPVRLHSPHPCNNTP